MQFSNENECPILSVLTYLRPAGGPRCVLIVIVHILLLVFPCGVFGWVNGVKVSLECIHVSGPESAELRQPGIDLLKRLGFQAVQAALCVYRGFHETGISKHSQVLRHGRLGHPKLPLDTSNRLLGRRQEAQYCAAVRLRNDLEHRYHVKFILQFVYTCQGI